ncbi:MAG: TIGR02452 family protein [Atopobiaceae bacterium]|nr:TIGR02452 family protein [Atopobiaceae bacterium]
MEIEKAVAFMGNRGALIRCFNDTMRMCRNEMLVGKVEASREGTRLVGASDALVTPDSVQDVSLAKVSVSPDRTFEAARRLVVENPGSRCAVLNFASPVNPGGGVVVGSRAQEECLCRCSTLYPCLDQRRLWEGYYLPNRAAHDTLASDDCIYTPNVVVVKADGMPPALLPRDQWFEVDVLTCAAPNLRDFKKGFPADELFRIHLTRARRVLSVAASFGVRTLVLGAFGCGAFNNDPHVVAPAWHQAVNELGGWFDTIEFAVWCPPQGSVNYDAFCEEFGQS